jgi:hypothetical protein
VISLLGKGPIVKTAVEIGQLDGAIQTFKTTYGVSYIPSQIRLCAKLGTYTARPSANPQLDQDSVNYLNTLFPMMLTNWSTNGIDWNGDGVLDDDVILEGEHCLVFFLGGIQGGTANGVPLKGGRTGPAICLGFSTDPTDPVKLSQTTGRKGPFFEFPNDRLVLKLPSGATPTASAKGFFMFQDVFERNVYAYFSNFGTRNGYNRYGQSVATSDCVTLAVLPYLVSVNSPVQYQNPESWQIICAGVDGHFGPGNVAWTQSTAGTAAPPPAKDDQANFNGGSPLGAAAGS